MGGAELQQEIKIQYELLEQEVIETLEKNKIWVLATSSGNKVKARSIGIVNNGLNIYFQTELLQEKGK